MFLFPSRSRVGTKHRIVFRICFQTGNGGNSVSVVSKRERSQNRKKEMLNQGPLAGSIRRPRSSLGSALGTNNKHHEALPPRPPPIPQRAHLHHVVKAGAPCIGPDGYSKARSLLRPSTRA